MAIISAVIGAVMGGLLSWLAMTRVTDRQTRTELATTLTMTFMHRYSEPAFVRIRDEVDGFLASIRPYTWEEKVDAAREVCRRQDANAIQLYNRLHAVGMFFAEIGVGFATGLIDVRGLAIFDRLLPQYWHEMAPFIVAAHIEFGFEVDLTSPLVSQDLALFNKFRYAYAAMVEQGIARQPIALPADIDGPDERAAEDA